ncbi:MAG TPA: hypothetical protein VI386_27825 [Candidatus Sulfotelmatobacter sp.]
MKFAEMKIARTYTMVSKSMVLGAALILASNAFAASKASLQLNGPVMINGTKLRAGDYKLQWEGNGPDVEVSIMQGKNVVAKAPAHIVNLETPAVNSAAVTRRSDDGTSTLAGVRFSGKKYALDLNESHDHMQAGSAK